MTDPTQHEHEALEVLHLGRLAYSEAHALQQRLVEERLSGAAPDRLLLVEHDPVVTVGRSPRSESAAELEPLLAGLDCPVVEVERGGEATWHGPGQLVAYPIVLLTEGRRDLHAWLRLLEQAILDTLAHYGIEGRREPGLTGVWIGVLADAGDTVTLTTPAHSGTRRDHGRNSSALCTNSTRLTRPWQPLGVAPCVGNTV